MEKGTGMTTLPLKRGLLVFWGLWLAVVFATNLGDALKQLGVLSPSWSFASGNYQLISKTTAIHGVPGWINVILFLGVLVWELTAAVLFFRAARSLAADPPAGYSAVYAAFGAGLGLWSALAIACELFMAYDVESAHISLLIAQLASLLVVRLMPDR
jgi:hypothetical protein